MDSRRKLTGLLKYETDFCAVCWISNLEVFEEYHLLGYDDLKSVEFQPTFWRNISPPSICLLAGFAEPISSTLKMEAICSSETSVETQRNTRRHIPEDDTLHNHRCENLKSYIGSIWLEHLHHSVQAKYITKVGLGKE
jgi:hypothetical protein